MQVWLGFTKLTVEVIEWADVERRQPVAFLATCFKCNRINWSRVCNLYKAYDGTLNNFRCKHCNFGKLKAGELKPKQTDFSVFKPKQVGWHRLDNNAK